MSLELDRIRKSEQRKQLLMLPLATILAAISILLYVFHLTNGFEIYGHYIWGASKYIWLTTVIIFLGFSLAAIFTLIFSVSVWVRLKQIPNFKLKTRIIFHKTCKYLVLAGLSGYACYFSSLWILKSVNAINGYLQFDSALLELTVLLAWIAGIHFILGLLIGYVIFAIKAPFEFIKDNQVHMDYSANDGRLT